MALPKDIVVATDFSESAEKAVRAAVALAKVTDARVHLVHSWAGPVGSATEASLRSGELVRQNEADAETAMMAAVTALRGELPELVGTVRPGDPRDVVPRLAAEVNAGLIVLGTTGRSGLRRMLLGSVAESIARNAACSVMIVR